MYGVIRFLDTSLLPASSPEDYPKIIKSGIDDEGQHHKLPSITGPSGIATLLHKIGRQQLLERLFDTEGTQEYDLRVFMNQEYFSDIYVHRRGREVEIGFINSEGERAQHGVRYHILPEPADSPYHVGKWIPLCTSDLGSAWGGTDMWVRGQGAAVAKAVWFHRYYDLPEIEVSWSGMTATEKEDLAVWLKGRAEVLAEREKLWQEDHKKEKAEFNPRNGTSMYMLQYYRSRMACRADCGEQNPKLVCSKCRLTRYCNASCQSADWKYHKTYCGTENPIPKEYLGLL